MSPKIGMSLATRGLLKDRRTPAAKVNAAIQMMADQGIPLRNGDHGVAPCPFASGWCVDRRFGNAVNVVGAVLLALQPEEGDDPVAAAAGALETTIAFVEGLCDGWDRARQAERFLGDIHVRAYLDGYETGMEARFRATVVCRCGARRFKAEPRCAECGAEVHRKTHK
jgi:hypothetical protein